MKIIFTLLFAFLSVISFGQQTKITTSTTSAALKTAMVAKESYPMPGDLDAFYLGSTLGVILGTNQSGKLRVMVNSNSYTDLINADEPTMSRAWSKDALIQWAVQNYIIENYSETTQGGNFIISFTVNGLPYSGTSNNDATAAATAILALLAI